MLPGSTAGSCRGLAWPASAPHPGMNTPAQKLCLMVKASLSLSRGPGAGGGDDTRLTRLVPGEDTFLTRVPIPRPLLHATSTPPAFISADAPEGRACGIVPLLQMRKLRPVVVERPRWGPPAEHQLSAGGLELRVHGCRSCPSAEELPQGGRPGRSAIRVGACARCGQGR